MLLESLQPIFLALFFLLNGQILANIQPGEEGNCDVVRLTEFPGKRLGSGDIEMHCMSTVECFFKCLSNPKCLSFAVTVNESCTGTSCVLYSRSTIKYHLFLEDRNSSYYFMESSCCKRQCLNGGLCKTKSCECACKDGFTSTQCICPQSNVNQGFSHKWKTVGDSSMKQVDSGVQTWAVNGPNSWRVWRLQDGAWIQVDGLLSHVTSGKSGVWGVNVGNNIFYRVGVTTITPSGTHWIQIPGALIQIDSGNTGVVYGINRHQILFCRSGITDILPYGNHWPSFAGTYKYVSCGDNGCWVIKMDNSVSFRTGITSNLCKGTDWIDVGGGSFVQLDANFKSAVYAVTSDNILYYRYGICAGNPIGSAWKQVKGTAFKHVTVGDDSLFAIATNGTIFTSV